MKNDCKPACATAVRILLAFAITAFFLPAASASGENASRSVDPPDVWRGLTSTWSSSRCIGRPITPVCAVETKIACFARGAADLCKQVFGPALVEAFPSLRSVRQVDAIRYRVIEVEMVRPEDVPAIHDTFKYRNPSYWAGIPESVRIRPDDARVVTIEFECTDEGKRCVRSIRTMIYYARREKDRWSLIDWRMRDPDKQ